MKIFRDPEVVAGLTMNDPFAGFRGITHCGEALCSRFHSLPLHAHAGIELHYLIFGEITWQFGNRTLKQASGELSLINPGISHKTRPGAHPEFKALCLGLDLTTLGREGISLQQRLGKRDVYNLGWAPEFEAVLRGVIHLAMFPPASGNRVARKFTELLMAMIELRFNELAVRRGTKKERPRIFSLPVQKAVHYLDQHPGRRVSVAELARVAHLGESHFAVLFKREVGLTPCKYHRESRLEAARTALRMPENSVAHIAQELGFSSSQHLSTLFRQAFGLHRAPMAKQSVFVQLKKICPQISQIYTDFSLSVNVAPRCDGRAWA